MQGSISAGTFGGEIPDAADLIAGLEAFVIESGSCQCLAGRQSTGPGADYRDLLPAHSLLLSRGHTSLEHYGVPGVWSSRRIFMTGFLRGNSGAA